MTGATLQMMRLACFAGIGVSTKDDDVFMAFDTDGDLVDITMTKEQAEELGNKLLYAARSSCTGDWKR